MGKPGYRFLLLVRRLGSSGSGAGYTGSSSSGSGYTAPSQTPAGGSPTQMPTVKPTGAPQTLVTPAAQDPITTVATISPLPTNTAKSGIDADTGHRCSKTCAVLSSCSGRTGTNLFSIPLFFLRFCRILSKVPSVLADRSVVISHGKPYASEISTAGSLWRSSQGIRSRG